MAKVNTTRRVYIAVTAALLAALYSAVTAGQAGGAATYTPRVMHNSNVWVKGEAPGVTYHIASDLMTDGSILTVPRVHLDAGAKGNPFPFPIYLFMAGYWQTASASVQVRAGNPSTGAPAVIQRCYVAPGQTGEYGDITLRRWRQDPDGYHGHVAVRMGPGRGLVLKLMGPVGSHESTWRAITAEQGAGTLTVHGREIVDGPLPDARFGSPCWQTVLRVPDALML